VQGHQGFHLNSIEGASKPEAEWMAKMFKIALKAHNTALLKKYVPMCREDV